MRIATWNVNSVRARLPRLHAWLGAHRPEVVCLQETKVVDEDFPADTFEALGYEVAFHGQRTYNGVAILSTLPLTDVVRGMPGDAPDAEARLLTATAGGVRVCTAYVINGREVGHAKYTEKLAWMGRLADYLRGFDLAAPVVLNGDFNVTFDDRDVYDPKRWHEHIHCSTPEREALTGIMDVGLSDALRKFTEEAGHYTWWDFRTRGFQRGHGLRIDHMLMSASALDACTGLEVDVEERGQLKPSDHAPLVATLDI